MTDLPPNTVDPFGIPGSGSGFAPGTITARVLQTAGGTGQRIVIESDPSTGISEIDMYPGIVPAEAPALLQTVYNGSSLTTTLQGAGEQPVHPAPKITLQSQLAAGDPSNIAILADTLIGFGGSVGGQANPIGNIPMVDNVIPMAGSYNPLTQWPLIQVFERSLVTAGAGGLVTVNWPQPFPNGVLGYSIDYQGGGGALAYIRNSPATVTGVTIGFFVTTTGSGVGAGVPVTVACIALGF